jgi:hypothetical protein
MVQTVLLSYQQPVGLWTGFEPVTSSLAYFATMERKLRLEAIPAWQLFRDYQACPPNATDAEVREFFATRESPQRRVDRASWNQMSHEEWVRRCDVIAAPAWTHPNGGLYLYGTDAFGLMFAEIISNLLPTGGKHDLGCDECLIVNHLWTFHRSSIRFLPPDFNINLHQTPSWANNPVMQSYIYHFIGPTKMYLDEVLFHFHMQDQTQFVIGVQRRNVHDKLSSLCGLLFAFG